jgi:hypothetical protein
VLSGSTGNNVIRGGAGNDSITGAGGTDNYLFGRGDGQDTVVNGIASNTGPTGELDFDTGVAKDQVWLLQSGNDLVVEIMGSSDRVTISGWYTSNKNQVQAIKTTDGAWVLDSGVASLVSAMGTYSSSHPGFDPTTVSQAPADTTLQNAITAAWHN